MGITCTSVSTPSLVASGATISVPGIVQNGDQIWFTAMRVNATTSFTLAGGLGASFATVLAAFTTVLGGSTCTIQVWNRNWNTGDPTSFTCTPADGGGFIYSLFILHSDFVGAGSWTRANGTGFRTAATPSPVVKQVSPADATFDYRIVHVWQSGGVTIYSASPAGYLLGQRSGQPATSPCVSLMTGSGPQNFDSADGSIINPSVSQDAYTIGYAIHDGSGAYYSAFKGDPEYEMDATANVYSLGSATGGDDSTSNQWEGGGARLLS